MYNMPPDPQGENDIELTMSKYAVVNKSIPTGDKSLKACDIKPKYMCIYHQMLLSEFWYILVLTIMI